MNNPSIIVEIDNIRYNETANAKAAKDEVIFFAVSFTIPNTSFSCLIDNFKWADGKLYPPQRRGNNWFYDTAAFSPEFAEAIKDAFGKRVEESGIQISPDATKPLKWSLLSLTRLLGPDSEERAFEIWSKGKKENPQ